MILLDEMQRRGLLQPIDVHFARLVARMSGTGDAELLAAIAALVSRERDRGHSCIVIDEIAGSTLPGDDGADGPTLPDPADCRRALDASPLVGDGSTITPLVRDAAGRVYLYRYWRAEQRVAQWIAERTSAAANEAVPVPDADLAAAFRRLFPALDAGGDRRQAMAAALALDGKFTVVSGGPGTGKTTTVTRILALLAQSHPDARIELAAPTGKAAARLTESIAREVARLGVEPDVAARIPSKAATVHRLLGGHRGGKFRYDADRPLPADVVIVDEASMIDLTLMEALLTATRPSARVMLLGDRNQLASVEAGFVFGDVCIAAERLRGDAGYGRAVCERFEQLTGYGFAETATERQSAGSLGDATVELRTSYRFAPDSGIGALASAICGADSTAAVAAINDARAGDVARSDFPTHPAGALEPVRRAIAAYLASADAAQALEQLSRFRILCATRVGPWGANNMNRAAEEIIQSLGHGTSDPWYAGRPIMVTANDYQVGLFNGDVGVCWPAKSGDGGGTQTRAWFPTAGGDIRGVPIARLPAHQTAWAMTVHKSQGSEFDHVLLVLPDRDTAVVTRELLYTGVTRARTRLDVVADAALFSTWVARSAARRSGLLDRLLAE